MMMRRKKEDETGKITEERPDDRDVVVYAHIRQNPFVARSDEK